MKSFLSFMKEEYRIQLNELVHMYNVLSSEGKEFIDNLFSKKVTISIKVDGVSFLIRKEKGKISYIGREGKYKINKLKRASLGFYEPFINHIESRDLDKLPDDVEISFELFINDKYSIKPKNDAVLLFIEKGGKRLKPDDPLHEKLARILDVSPPPVVFAGKLNSKQKEAIWDFIDMGYETREAKYGGKSFVEFVLNLVEIPKRFKFATSADLLEGIVFFFGDDDKPFMAKVVDPLYTVGLMKKKAETRATNANEFRKIIAGMIIKEVDLKKIEKKIESLDQVTEDDYIDIVSDIASRAMSKNSSADLSDYRDAVENNRVGSIAYNLLPKYVSEVKKGLPKKVWWADDLVNMALTLFSKHRKGVTNYIGNKANLIILQSVTNMMQEKGLDL